MDPHGKSTRSGLPHTDVSHGCVHLVGLKHDLHRYTTGPCLFNSLDHERVTRTCPYRAQV
ncbi:putative outer membrane pmpA [Gossypium arboreum]|uniref:Putative outer membrane pmpA n=1 Tax=Gossypium arboreum TaxID=29729 RepID=A0A0B0PVE6_GOSAR|nr:putative outer membrane pmpA [Gossypium arboreum]